MEWKLEGDKLMYKEKEWFDSFTLPTVDLTNKIFDKLTVVSFAGIRKRIPYWNCECNCGNGKTISQYSLLKGTTKSCGCLKKEMMQSISREKPEDIVGNRYGRLIVLENVGRRKGSLMCKVRCDCGKEKIVYKHHLISGNTTSCGCFSLEVSASLMSAFHKNNKKG